MSNFVARSFTSRNYVSYGSVSSTSDLHDVSLDDNKKDTGLFMSPPPDAPPPPIPNTQSNFSNSPPVLSIVDDTMSEPEWIRSPTSSENTVLRRHAQEVSIRNLKITHQIKSLNPVTINAQINGLKHYNAFTKFLNYSSWTTASLNFSSVLINKFFDGVYTEFFSKTLDNKSWEGFVDIVAPIVASSVLTFIGMKTGNSTQNEEDFPTQLHKILQKNKTKKEFALFLSVELLNITAVLLRNFTSIEKTAGAVFGLQLSSLPVLILLKLLFKLLFDYYPNNHPVQKLANEFAVLLNITSMKVKID